MKTLAVVAKRGNPEAAVLARELRVRYPSLELQAERDFAQELGWAASPATAPDFPTTAELLVVLGGDGTLIHAARLLRGRAVPILGVNLGSLGFLTEIPRTELFRTLDLVLAGRATVHDRMKLGCRLVRAGAVVLEDEVFNDVVINKGALARIADHETFVNGRYLTTYKSDGVIVATPTGSTAYALAAGGPILHPGLDCALIAPICPHALTQRPIVLPGECVISIVLKSPGADVYLTLDGQEGHPLQTEDRLEVFRSQNRVLLVQNPEVDPFAILRQKLKWGER